jgi:hypothetical protein
MAFYGPPPCRTLQCPQANLLFTISAGYKEMALYRTIPVMQCIWINSGQELRAATDCHWSSDGYFIIFPTDGILMYRETGASIAVAIGDETKIHDAYLLSNHQHVIVVRHQASSMTFSAILHDLSDGAVRSRPLVLPRTPTLLFHKVTPEGAQIFVNDCSLPSSKLHYLLAPSVPFERNPFSSPSSHCALPSSVVQHGKDIIQIIAKVTTALITFGISRIIQMYVEADLGAFRELVSETIQPLGMTFLGSKLHSLAASLLKHTSSNHNMKHHQHVQWEQFLRETQEQWDHLQRFARSVVAADAATNDAQAVSKWIARMSPTDLAYVIKFAEDPGASKLHHQLEALQKEESDFHGLISLQLHRL